MPTHDGVGRDDRGDAVQQPAAERLALRRESSPLVIREAKSSAAKLFLEDAVLFDEVRDDVRLLAVDPAREGGEQELKREEVGHHAR